MLKPKHSSAVLNVESQRFYRVKTISIIILNMLAVFFTTLAFALKVQVQKQ